VALLEAVQLAPQAKPPSRARETPRHVAKIRKPLVFLPVIYESMVNFMGFHHQLWDQLWDLMGRDDSYPLVMSK